MAENKNNLSINDDHSNAAMTHTSDAIASSDFIIRELDLNQEPENATRKQKLLARCLGSVKTK